MFFSAAGLRDRRWEMVGKGRGRGVQKRIMQVNWDWPSRSFHHFFLDMTHILTWFCNVYFLLTNLKNTSFEISQSCTRTGENSPVTLTPLVPSLSKMTETELHSVTLLSRLDYIIRSCTILLFEQSLELWKKIVSIKSRVWDDCNIKTASCAQKRAS